MKSEARQKMLAEGARLVHRKGFNNTGIAEIVQAAGVPKGSFYFYFPSKEMFGLALIDEYVAFIQGVAGECWQDVSIPPLQRLKSFYRRFRDFFIQNEFRDGCPIGNLCLEMADTNDAFQEKLSQAMSSLLMWQADALRLAKDQGDLPKNTDPATLSGFIMSAWQGAILQMKALRNSAPLDVFETVVFDQILRSVF
jgi:TetR/AcrR family transcriptional regulator, transcriptional repressor for nem operon